MRDTIGARRSGAKKPADRRKIKMLYIIEGTDHRGRKFRGLYDKDTAEQLLKSDPTNVFIGAKVTTQLPLKTGE